MSSETKNRTNKDFDCFIVICSPREGQSAQDVLNKLALQEYNFIKLIKPDSLYIRKTNTLVFIPFIQEDIGALLLKLFSKRKNQIGAFTKSCIGINFKQHFAVCHHSNSDYLFDLLISKYVSNRFCYTIKCDEFINVTSWTSKTKENCGGTEDEVADDPSDPVISLKQDWLPVHLVVKQNEHEQFQTKPIKKRNFEKVQSEEALSDQNHLLAYLKNDRVTQYVKRKQNPSVCKDKQLVSKKQTATDLKKDTVSASNTVGVEIEGKGFKTPRVPSRRRKKRKTDTEYRKSCPDFSSKKFLDIHVSDDNLQGIFSDPENVDNFTDLGKNVSIKEFRDKNGDLPLEIRKDLREITNLPLRQYPVRRQDAIVFPGGRKKKSDRPTERRPQQRSPAQNQSIHAQVDISLFILR